MALTLPLNPSGSNNVGKEQQAGIINSTDEITYALSCGGDFLYDNNIIICTTRHPKTRDPSSIRPRVGVYYDRTVHWKM